MNAELTDTQTAVLKATAGHKDGNIELLPANLRGGKPRPAIGRMEKREASEAWWAGKCTVGAMAKHQTPPKAPPVLAWRAEKTQPIGVGF